MGSYILIRSRFASFRVESMGRKKGKRQGCSGWASQACTRKFFPNETIWYFKSTETSSSTLIFPRAKVEFRNVSFRYPVCDFAIVSCSLVSCLGWWLLSPPKSYTNIDEFHYLRWSMMTAMKSSYNSSIIYSWSTFPKIPKAEWINGFVYKIDRYQFVNTFSTPETYWCWKLIWIVIVERKKKSWENFFRSFFSSFQPKFQLSHPFDQETNELNRFIE